MTIIQVSTNTELRSLPFGRKAGYSAYRSLMDQAGRVQNIGGFGDAQVGERLHDIVINFQYGYFTDQLNIATANGGTIDNDKSMIRLTATNAGDLVDIESKNAIIYRSGYDAQTMFTAAFTTFEGVADVIQRIGAFDTQDGFFIGAKDNQLSIGRYKGGVLEDEIVQDNFSQDKLDGTGTSGFKIDITKLNIFRIQYGYLGILPITFEVFGGDQVGFIPFHTIDLTNKQLDTSIENPNLPITMHCEVVSGNPGVPVELRSASWYGGSIGSNLTLGDLIYFGVKNTLALGLVGAELPILGIRNKTTFRSKINRLRIDMTYFSFFSDGNKPVAFDVYLNPTLTGAIWADVDTNNSVVEVTKNSDTTWTDGRYIGSMLLDKVGGTFIQFATSEVRLSPGDVVFFVAQSTSNSDIAISARWGEAR